MSRPTLDRGPKGLWLVLDGRALAGDIERAIVLEVLYDGHRNEVPRKEARREWKRQGAALCFAPANDDGTCGPAQLVEAIP